MEIFSILTAGPVLPATVLLGLLAGWSLLALLGAAVATFCDAMHVFTHTLSYPKPFLYGQAAFVFPGFFGAFLIMGGAYRLLVRYLPQSVERAVSTSPGDQRELTESLISFALVYLLSAFGNHQPGLLAYIFYATALLRLTVSQDRTFMVILAVTLAVYGVLAEGAMTMANLVQYREPEIFGVPVWLGGLYMHGAFGLRAGMRWFVYRTPTEQNGGGGGI